MSRGEKRLESGVSMVMKYVSQEKSSSRQGKGVASTCEKPGAFVEGVLFQLTNSDWDRLDEYEGVPKSYTRKLVTISMNAGKETVAETYIAKAMEGSPFKPSKAYLDLIIHGAQENGLSVDYIEKLKRSRMRRGEDI